MEKPELVTDLPLEILRNVWSFIKHPTDIWNLAQTCKKFEAAGRITGNEEEGFIVLGDPHERPIQDHKNRIDNETSFSYCQEWSEVLSTYLEGLVTGGWQSLYLKEVFLGDWNDHFRNDHYEDDFDLRAMNLSKAEWLKEVEKKEAKLQVARDRQLKLFSEELQKLEVTQDRPEIQSAISQGDEEPLLALFLMQLKKVTRLDLRVVNSDSVIFEVLQYIADNPGLKILSKLTYASIHGSNSDIYSDSLEWSKAFFALPSVTKFKGVDVSSWGVHPFEDPLLPATSNVEDFELMRCRLNETKVAELLRSTKSLRRFYFSYGAASSPTQSTRMLINTLVGCARHSLEAITLTRGQFVGSLAPFAKLREVVIDFGMLLDLSPGGPISLHRNLPGSIETLCLCNIPGHYILVLHQIAQDAVDFKEESWPKLHELIFQVWRRDNQPPINLTNVKARCAHAGIALSLEAK